MAGVDLSDRIRLINKSRGLSTPDPQSPSKIKTTPVVHNKLANNTEIIEPLTKPEDYDRIGLLINEVSSLREEVSSLKAEIVKMNKHINSIQKFIKKGK